MLLQKQIKKTHFNLILVGEVCRLHVGASGGGVMLCKWNQALEQQLVFVSALPPWKVTSHYRGGASVFSFVKQSTG